MLEGFYPITFVYSHFPLRNQFLYSVLSSVALWGGPMIDTEGDIFWNLGLVCWKKHFLGFPWNLRVSWGVLKKKFICVCKYLNQRVRRIGEQNEKKKKNDEIEFHNSIQILVFYYFLLVAWKSVWLVSINKYQRKVFAVYQNLCMMNRWWVSKISVTKKVLIQRYW